MQNGDRIDCDLMDFFQQDQEGDDDNKYNKNENKLKWVRKVFLQSIQNKSPIDQ